MMLFVYSVQGQKTVRKAIIDSNTSYIRIDLDNCFKIHMETLKTDEVIVNAMIDGEYVKDLVLNVTEEGSMILINAGFQPNFIDPNDKLSAHKVVSIALEVFLPSHKTVQLYGTNCNVVASGDYKNLKITLDDGQCSLLNVSESAEIITQSGDIFVSSTGASIIANSKYGTVQKEQLPVGHSQFRLSTTMGNIHIKNND